MLPMGNVKLTVTINRLLQINNTASKQTSDVDVLS